ncbi:MAG: hypothetical protein ABGX07_21335 [Pirellulaceae bacterium]|jgi:hypothetical protein|nr:hypothetical protein [Planctomycetota bacterium]
MYRPLIGYLVPGLFAVGFFAGCRNNHETETARHPSSSAAVAASPSSVLRGSDSIETRAASGIGDPLTDAEVEDRYRAVDPNDPRFYPGRAHPLAYARWDLHRPEGELSRRLSDRFTNIELTTQDGEKVRFYDDLVKDKIVVISFMYTKCNGI